MIIRSVWLQGMRNYSNLAVSFSDTTTVIVGDNAIGKTNLLEAIYLLATGKSFRAESDRELISFSADLARIKGIIENNPIQKNNETIKQSNNDARELEVVLTRGEVQGRKTTSKRYAVNGIGKRMIDFVGCFRCVLFWPQDLELVTDSPSYRRRYLDRVLAQADRGYWRALIPYEQALRRRNRVLEAIREGSAGPNELPYWNDVLIGHGTYIHQSRRGYIDFLNTCTVPVSEKLLPRFRLLYNHSDISEARLKQYSAEEIQAGMTLVGPHRDDVTFLFNNTVSPVNVAKFGSRGEQRLAVLWVKIGESAYIEHRTGEQPPLLLDDIFSELDPRHRTILDDLICNRQTIITTTDLSHIDAQIRKRSRIHQLPLCM